MPSRKIGYATSSGFTLVICGASLYTTIAIAGLRISSLTFHEREQTLFWKTLHTQETERAALADLIRAAAPTLERVDFCFDVPEPVPRAALTPILHSLALAPGLTVLNLDFSGGPASTTFITQALTSLAVILPRLLELRLTHLDLAIWPDDALILLLESVATSTKLRIMELENEATSQTPALQTRLSMNQLAYIVHAPLTQIRLSLSTLHRGIVRQLCQHPWNCSSLRSLALFLYSNDLQPEDGHTLTLALGRIQSLTSLRLGLSDNQLGDMGVLGLMSMAVALPALIDFQLYADDNQLTLSGRGEALELAQQLLNRGLLLERHHLYTGFPWEVLLLHHGPEEFDPTDPY